MKARVLKLMVTVKLSDSSRYRNAGSADAKVTARYSNDMRKRAVDKTTQPIRPMLAGEGSGRARRLCGPSTIASAWRGRMLQLIRRRAEEVASLIPVLEWCRQGSECLAKPSLATIKRQMASPLKSRDARFWQRERLVWEGSSSTRPCERRSVQT